MLWNKQKATLTLIAAVVFLLIPPGRSHAQLGEDADAAFLNKLDSYLSYIPSRSVEAMPGKVGIVEVESEYSRELKLFDKLPVTLSLGTQYVGIEDSVSVELPPHLTGLTADVETTFPCFNFDKTYLRVGISPSFYGEDWNFPASSFRMPSRFMVIRAPNTRWTFIAGIAVCPDFENEVLPVLGFIYKPNDKLTFNIVPKRPSITYRLNEKVLLFGEGGGLSSREFEVSRDTAENVVLRYRQMRLGAGVKLKINESIGTSLSAGTVFNRSLKYRDDLGKVVIKDGLYLQVRTEIRF